MMEEITSWSLPLSSASIEDPLSALAPMPCWGADRRRSPVCCP